jgi:hypothetical protein
MLIIAGAARSLVKGGSAGSCRHPFWMARLEGLM